MRLLRLTIVILTAIFLHGLLSMPSRVEAQTTTFNRVGITTPSGQEVIELSRNTADGGFVEVRSVSGERAIRMTTRNSGQVGSLSVGALLGELAVEASVNDLNAGILTTYLESDTGFGPFRSRAIGLTTCGGGQAGLLVVSEKMVSDIQTGDGTVITLDGCSGAVFAEDFVSRPRNLSVPDYVFNKDYDLMPLDDLRTYIDKNHHLPDIPNDAEIKKDGIKVGELQMKLLKKIEELTLYTLKQQKILQAQQTKIEELAKKLQ